MWGQALSVFLFTLELQGNAINKEKEIKDIQIGKEEIKLYLLTDDIIIPEISENLKQLIKKLLELISNYSKVIGFKVHTQKLTYFLYISN